MVGSAQPWHYRNQIQFHLNPAGPAGFVEAEQRRRDEEQILAIQECHLPMETDQ